MLVMRLSPASAAIPSAAIKARALAMKSAFPCITPTVVDVPSGSMISCFLPDKKSSSMLARRCRNCAFSTSAVKMEFTRSAAGSMARSRVDMGRASIFLRRNMSTGLTIFQEIMCQGIGDLLPFSHEPEPDALLLPNIDGGETRHPGVPVNILYRKLKMPPI